MKGMQIIQMFTAADTDAAAVIDVPDNGEILMVEWEMAQSGGGAADFDGVRAELSFGSVSSFATNDARQVICGIMITTDLTGVAANTLRGDARKECYYDEGITVAAGERLYLHIGDIANGGNAACYCRIGFRFSGQGVARRR